MARYHVAVYSVCVPSGEVGDGGCLLSEVAGSVLNDDVIVDDLEKLAADPGTIVCVV